MNKDMPVRETDLLEITLPGTVAPNSKLRLTPEQMEKAYKLWQNKIDREKGAAYFLDFFFALYDVPDNAPFFPSKEEEERFYEETVAAFNDSDGEESSNEKWQRIIFNWIKENLLPKWVEKLQALAEKNQKMIYRMPTVLAETYGSAPTPSEFLKWLSGECQEDGKVAHVITLMSNFVWGRDVQYYEVDLTEDFSMCIRAVKEPTLEGLNEFLATDLKSYGGDKVLRFNPIDRKDAESSYDMDNEADWPVYGMEE